MYTSPYACIVIAPAPASPARRSLARMFRVALASPSLRPSLFAGARSPAEKGAIKKKHEQEDKADNGFCNSLNYYSLISFSPSFTVTARILALDLFQHIR